MTRRGIQRAEQLVVGSAALALLLTPGVSEPPGAPAPVNRAPSAAAMTAPVSQGLGEEAALCAVEPARLIDGLIDGPPQPQALRTN